MSKEVESEEEFEKFLSLTSHALEATRNWGLMPWASSSLKGYYVEALPRRIGGWSKK